MPNQNPYAPPASYLEPESPNLPAPAFHRIVVRWLTICGLSAAPSFYFGLMFGTDVVRVSAMLIGISLYVVAYVWADIYWARPKLTQNPRLRRTVRIAYSSRVAISLFFPVAMFLDMPCGMISTGLVQSIPLLGAPMNIDARTAAGDATAFVAILLTTITQGVLLHVVLFGYMGIVHTIQILAGSGKPQASR